MRSMTQEQFFWRVLAETGQPPYFGGAGIGLLPALYEAGGLWPAAVCVDDPASPVAAWLTENTDAELFFFPKAPRAGRGLPPVRSQGTWDRGTVPLVVGDSERDAISVDAIAFGFGTQPRFYRQRTLDGLLGESRRLGLIHIGSFRGAAAVLEGARRQLERSGPVVLIVRDTPVGAGEDLAELTAVAEILSGAGYRLHDAMLNPRGTPDALRGALADWQESVFFGLPAGYDLEALMRPFWAGLTSYRKGTETGVSLRADEIVDCSGLYPAERWEDLCWRWTGPLPVASLRVPLQRPGLYRLRCRLLKVADDRVFDSLRIFVNGEAVEHTVRTREHDILLKAAVTVSLARFSPVADLRFVHSETYSVNPDDPRRLGLALMDIELERQAQ